MRRLPLLTSAIASRLPWDSTERPAATEALKVLSALVEKCNESARKVQRMEELIALSKQLDFRYILYLLFIIRFFPQ
jgi:hypothetical protein